MQSRNNIFLIKTNKQKRKKKKKKKKGKGKGKKKKKKEKKIPPYNKLILNWIEGFYLKILKLKLTTFLIAPGAS